MRVFLDPSPDDQKEFLIRCYFGMGTDYLSHCIHRAYLDFCRTLHGVGKSTGIYAESASAVRGHLDALRTTNAMDPVAVDNWHERRLP